MVVWQRVEMRYKYFLITEVSWDVQFEINNFLKTCTVLYFYFQKNVA